MKIQISKHIPQVKDRYYIDDDGYLYTDYGERKLNECQQYKGYIKNWLIFKNGKGAAFFRHRLVMMRFNPVENMKNLQVNHIDGNKQNNSLSNLE